VRICRYLGFKILYYYLIPLLTINTQSHVEQAKNLKSDLTLRSFRRRVAKDIEDDLAPLNFSAAVVTNNGVIVSSNDLNVNNTILESESDELNSSSLTLNNSILNEHSDSLQFKLNNSDENALHDFYNTSFIDEESSINNSPPQIKDEIAYWALEYKIKHNALDAFLLF